MISVAKAQVTPYNPHVRNGGASMSSVGAAGGDILTRGLTDKEKADASAPSSD